MEFLESPAFGEPLCRDVVVPCAVGVYLLYRVKCNNESALPVVRRTFGANLLLLEIQLPEGITRSGRVEPYPRVVQLDMADGFDHLKELPLLAFAGMTEVGLYALLLDGGRLELRVVLGQHLVVFAGEYIPEP